MTRTVDDFLSRRTRNLLLDANASLEAAPKVAEVMAKELNKDKNWIADQINQFSDIAKNYIAENFK